MPSDNEFGAKRMTTPEDTAATGTKAHRASGTKRPWRPEHMMGWNLAKQAALLLMAMTIGITGCSHMTGKNSHPPKRDINAARADAKKLTSQLFDLLDLRGKVENTGPAVGVCEGRDSSKFFTITQPWNIYNVPVPDLKKAIDRLKEKMPDNGWTVTSYGPDKSESRSLTLRADHPKKFSVTISLWERLQEKSENPSMIYAILASACFEAPEGQDVSGEY